MAERDHSENVLIGERLRMWRKRHSLNQEQLAEAVTDRGRPMTQQIVNKIELGTRGLALREAATFAAVLEIPIQQLLPYTEEDDAAGHVEYLAKQVSRQVYAVAEAIHDLRRAERAWRAAESELSDEARKKVLRAFRNMVNQDAEASATRQADEFGRVFGDEPIRG